MAELQNLGLVSVLTAANANGNSDNKRNHNHRGLTLCVDVTAISGTTPVLTVFVDEVDPTSLKTRQIAATAAINAVGTTFLSIHRNLQTVGTNTNAQLPYMWRVRWTITGTTPSVTANISAVALP